MGSCQQSVSRGRPGCFSTKVMVDSICIIFERCIDLLALCSINSGGTSSEDSSSDSEAGRVISTSFLNWFIRRLLLSFFLLSLRHEFRGIRARFQRIFSRLCPSLTVEEACDWVIDPCLVVDALVEDGSVHWSIQTVSEKKR